MRINILTLLLNICLSFNSFSQVVCQIVPTPSYYAVSGGEMYLPKICGVNWGDLPASIIRYGEFQLSSLLNVSTTSDKNSINFVFEPSLEEEAYSIHIDENIEIQYGHESGAFYALNSLIQLGNEVEKGIRFPKCKIHDKPKYKWRGLHLDVSRHFFTVEEVKRYIDLMALYKFNTFHWHLTDDQGWRIEIKKYPKLTEVGGYRDSTMIGHFSDQPRKYEVSKYGGYYTQEQIKDVVAYASERFIHVVPEIEMPGHSRAAIHAYPELSCSGVSKGIPGEWGIFDEIFCSKEETILFLQDVLSEVIDLFPSKYIHIGGDEAPKSTWKSCSTCHSNIAKYNLEDEHELQSYFIRRMDEFLTSNGRKLIGWDEILEGGLSENASVMSWRGSKGGIEAALQGHNVVMSPTTYCYFDYYQSSHRNEPIAIGGHLPLEKVYEFKVTPDELDPKFNTNIVGGQANLWTEYISDFEHVEYMVYPRALALIQSLWCENKPSYNEFLNVVIDHQEEFMHRNKIHFANSNHYPELIVERDNQGLNVAFQEADKQAVFNVRVHNNQTSLSSNYTLKSGEQMLIAHGRADNLTINVSPTTLDDTFQFNMVQHDNLGIHCETDPAPHEKYNHNGALNLVDGVYGSLPWKGGDWLGFDSSDVTLFFDFGQRKQMEGFKIGFLDIPGAWIYLPHSIEVMVSENEREWESVEMIKLESNDLSNGVVEIDKLMNGQYVKLIIHNLNEIPMGAQGAGNVPWTFIDEVEFKILHK